MKQAALIADFRRALRAKIARDIEQEKERAEALRTETLPRLADAIAALRAAGRIRDAWLFGSYAWGEPTDSSDLDLLVDTEASPFAIAAEVAHHTRCMVHVVLLAEAPQSLRERAQTDGRPL